MENEKDKKIKREIAKFKKIFKSVYPKGNIFAEKLYQQAAFMSVTLDELEEKINAEGAIIKTVNGNGFEVTMEHPAAKQYNAMIKNFNATIKALADLIPDNREESDELIDFIRGKKQ